MFKKGQISIEALIILSVLIIGGVIFASTYLGQRNKLAAENAKVLGTMDNIDYSGDFDEIVTPPTPPEPPVTNDCSPYPEHCCNLFFDPDLGEEGYNCGGDCASCEPVVEFGCDNLGEPTFNPESGTFNSPINLRLNYIDESCPDAGIRYTLDGTEPTISSPIFVPYNDYIEISSTKTVKAKVFAEKNGNTMSGDTATRYYEIDSTICNSTPGEVIFDPKGTTYNSQFKVTLSYNDKVCSSKFDILYTKGEDGVPPTMENIYSGPIELTDKDTVITARVRVMNSDSTYAFGDAKTETYNFNKFGCDGTIGQPTFNPVGGTYNRPVYLGITYNDGSCSDYNIHYTTDNTEPTTSSPKVGNRAISISVDKNITAKVFAKNSSGGDVNGSSKKEIYRITAGGSVLCASGVGGGTGTTTTDPKIICTPDELNDIRFGANLGKHYVLGQDIDLNHSILSNYDFSWGYSSTYGWTPIGLQTNVFTGSLDGNGYKIKNLYINRPDYSNELNFAGLFGYLGGTNPTIKNLELVDVNITGHGYVGALVGVSPNNVYSDLNNITVTNANIFSHYYSTGGIIGVNYSGTLSNSHSTGNIHGLEIVGGLVGSNGQLSSIINSSSSASVSGTRGIGGLIGVTGGQVLNSYSNGEISGQENIGGISGVVTTGDINQSYFSGEVTGNTMVGGITGAIGQNSNIVKSYCTSTASVNGQTKVGGIVGSLVTYNAYAIDLVTDSNFYGTVTGDSKVGGIVGFAQSSNAAGSYYKIKNVYFNGNVTGNSNIGGIIGDCSLVLLKYAQALGNITGTNNVGGIIGSGGTESEYLYFSGNINVVGNGSNIGGLVGSSVGNIYKSYSMGSITGSQGDNVGGAIGKCLSNSLISDSYSRVTVSGDSNVGGFIGHKWIGCGLRRNYSTGIVSGNSNVGGFLGSGYPVNTGCQWNYWNTQTSNQATTTPCNTSQYGYIVAGLTGRTTAQMNDWNSYGNHVYDGIPAYGGMGAPWDFVNTWNIDASKNNGYPYLRNNYSN